MRLNEQQLKQQLQKGLSPVYIISGDETLLVQECCDAVRKTCQDQGFSEREVLHADAQFNWQNLLASAQAMSLFAEKKLIELRFPSAKPGDAGAKVLQRYCELKPVDTVLLIVCNKLESATTRSKWYQTLEQAGVAVTVWPLPANQLARWIAGRLEQAGLRAERDAVQLLCERIEGNLLAAVQEIEKLALLAENNTVTVKTVMTSVGNNARYDLFQFVDVVLQGDGRHAIRMLQGLQAEGTDPTVITWALARELRTLYQCQRLLEQGQGIERVLQGQKIWDRRKPLVKQSLQRLGTTTLAQLIHNLADIDQTNKGMTSGNSWQKLELLTMGMVRGAV